jgi:hypothetical protein
MSGTIHTTFSWYSFMQVGESLFKKHTLYIMTILGIMYDDFFHPTYR